MGSAAFLLFPLIIGPRIHPQLIAVPLFYVAAYAVAVAYYLRRLAPATERVRRAFGQMNATLAESIEGIETVKGAAQEDREIRALSWHGGCLARLRRSDRAMWSRSTCLR
ncbi:MAG: hypothetical protein KatS3mg052_1008 [Candidatus Roseilinea sp.]|nr:MAG: hypothetical protein KatS3mg052_1008 [Candidatus Roseilinea sp.]